MSNNAERLEKEINLQIGRRIERIMKEKEMNQAKFARLAEISPQQLSTVLKGTRGFSITTLKKIAKNTGYPLSYIIEGNTTQKTINKLVKLERQSKALHDKVIETILEIREGDL